MNKSFLAAIAAVVLAIAGVWVWRGGSPSPSPARPAASMPADVVGESGVAASREQQDRRSRSSAEITATLPIPSGFQFAGIRETPAADSFDELLAQYSLEQRERIETFVGDYDQAAYAFSSAEELAWMAQRGFPMPDDILAAAEMSIDELKAQAEAGNVKAAFFYLSRETEDLPVNNYTNEPEARRAIHDNAILGDSPFYGYIEARRLSEQYPGHPSAFAPGLAWAAMIGDARASRRLAGVATDASGLTTGLLAILGDRRIALQLRGLQAELPVFEHYPMHGAAFQTFERLQYPSFAARTQ